MANPRAEAVAIVVRATGAQGRSPADVERLMIALGKVSDAAFTQVLELVERLENRANIQGACTAALARVNQEPPRGGGPGNQPSGQGAAR